MMRIDEMKNVCVKTVDRKELVDRSSVRIDAKAPRDERLHEFIRQIKNPYCYRDGKTVVKISFSNTNLTMEDCVAHYFQGL